MSLYDEVAQPGLLGCAINNTGSKSNGLLGLGFGNSSREILNPLSSSDVFRICLGKNQGRLKLKPSGSTQRRLDSKNFQRFYTKTSTKNYASGLVQSEIGSFALLSKCPKWESQYCLSPIEMSVRPYVLPFTFKQRQIGYVSLELNKTEKFAWVIDSKYSFFTESTFKYLSPLFSLGIPLSF